MKQLLLLTALMCVAPAALAVDYDGQWNRTSSQFSVNIESWGDYCGEQPRSYYTRKIKQVEILQNGTHLFFSSGGLRTDKCLSHNPEIKSVSQNVTLGNWNRVCSTSAGNPKFEKSEYSLKSSGSNKLIFVSKNKANWKLNNDTCIVSWTEKRVYERDAKVEPAVEASPIVKVHGADEKDAPSTEPKAAPVPKCEPNGTLKRIIIFPQNAMVSPGQKLCFQVRGVDTSGCRHAVPVQWNARQDGAARDDLIKANGCFTAGENATQSKGTYRVTAAASGVTATTKLTVAYPDIGALARANIDLSDEIAKKMKQRPLTPEEELELKSVENAEGKDNKSYGMLIGIIVSIVLVVIIGIVLGVRANRKKFDMSHKLKSRRDKVCPKCNRSFSADHDTCPHDNATLIMPDSMDADDSSQAEKMICPECSRAYDADARFCPHDSAELVSYHKWKMGEY